LCTADLQLEGIGMGLTTIRRLAILLATILVASGLIYLIQRYQVARMARDLREQARQAVKEGNTIDAIRLYQEHLEVVPKDQQAKLEYADALLKAGKTPPQQQMAIQIYEEVLNRTPGDLETRRRLAELLVETARWQDASLHLAILLRSFPDDGHLRFLLGTCSEQLGNLSEARDNYQRAIDQGAPERLEALQRLASLLRSEFKNPAEADRKIEEMVQSAPDDYRVYLERGRYRRRFSQTEEERKAAIDDYQKALAGAPERAEIYVELAEIFREASNPAQARHYLEAGLKAVPGDPSLYSSLALLDYATGDMNKAIADLQEGLKVLPDAANLHWLLAMFLADRGSANELRLQIDELKRIGYPTILLDFLEAHYQVNAQRWREASQILTRIQRDPNYEPRFPAAYKARLNTLLARCYAQLGDFEKERDARLRAYRAAPDDLRIRLGLVESLVKQGELDQAIDEYKKLAGQLPQVRGNLVRLLLARNQQRPAAQRDWTETQRLLDEMAREQPQASEPMILQAQMLLLQGKAAEAEERLKAARLQLPQDDNLWAASAALLRGQGKYDEALAVLEQARRLQGAKVPLLLEQARTLVAQDRPDVIGSLNALVETSSSLPREDRVRLLEGLAGEFSSLKDHARAVEIWTMVTRDDPGNLLPWIRLLDAAFASSSEEKTPIDATLKATVERALGEIRRLDTSDGLMSRYQEVRYAIWQAQHASDPIARETFRTRARSLLNELNSRRPDWSILPLAQASLVEQELAELMTAEPAASIKADEEKTENTPASDDRIRRKQDELANLYLQAIDRGQRSLLVLRRATEMLYASGRSAEVNQLWDRLPTPGLMPDSLQRMALDIALRNRDYERALDLARKAVQANP
jgi:tetratricopeptide (TPR) repeat protein